MASLRDSSSTPLLQGMLFYVEPHLLKTQSPLPPQPLFTPELLMKLMMLPHHLQPQRMSTLHQVLLHHLTSTTTLLLHLLLMGTSSDYVFKPFWSLLTKGGEAYVDSLQAGPYGWLLYFCLVFTTLVFYTFGSLSCNT